MCTCMLKKEHIERKDIIPSGYFKARICTYTLCTLALQLLRRTGVSSRNINEINHVSKLLQGNTTLSCNTMLCVIQWGTQCRIDQKATTVHLLDWRIFHGLLSCRSAGKHTWHDTKWTVIMCTNFADVSNTLPSSSRPESVCRIGNQWKRGSSDLVRRAVCNDKEHVYVHSVSSGDMHTTDRSWAWEVNHHNYTCTCTCKCIITRHACTWLYICIRTCTMHMYMYMHTCNVHVCALKMVKIKSTILREQYTLCSR